MKTFFETKILQKKLALKAEVQNELKRTSRLLPQVDKLGVTWSKKNYFNGYTSYGSLSDLHQQFSVFGVLKLAIDKEVRLFAKQVGLVFPRGKLGLSAIWVNIMKKNCYHSLHLHPNSILSGTYYLSVPKMTSPIRFEDPRCGLFMASPPRRIQQDLRPKVGEIVLFESWLKHEVPPNASNEERISVSFNYDWLQ